MGRRMSLPSKIFCSDFIRVVGIGWRQEYMDAYGDGARVRGVDDDGRTSTAPDHFVAWRWKMVRSCSGETLATVLNRVLPGP
jgi:hypothetical protein